MLLIAYQQLKSAAKWGWNRLNDYEHEVDFLRRMLKE